LKQLVVETNFNRKCIYKNFRPSGRGGSSRRKTYIYIYIICGATNPVGQSILIIEALRSHSDTPHSVGLLWTSDQPNSTLVTRHIHASRRIRTRNPSSRAAADPHIRSRGIHMCTYISIISSWLFKGQQCYHQRGAN